MTYADSHNYAKIKIDSDCDWPLEETLTMNNVVILIIQFLIKITISITIKHI